MLHEFLQALVFKITAAPTNYLINSLIPSHTQLPAYQTTFTSRVIDILSEWGSLYVLLKDGRVRLEGGLDGEKRGRRGEGRRDGKREEGREEEGGRREKRGRKDGGGRREERRPKGV